MGDYTPQSRSEEILYDTIHSLEYTERPQSRIEELLLELKAVIEAGSGTSDYEELEHLPKINSVELKGDKSLSDLGAASEGAVAAKASQSDIAPTFSDATAYTAGDVVYHEGSLYRFTANHSAGVWDSADVESVTVDDLVDGLKPVDSVTDGDMRPVTSNAVHDALALKADLPVDAVTNGEAKAVSSNAVYDYINESVSVIANGTETWMQLLNRLRPLINTSKIGARTVIAFSYNGASFIPSAAAGLNFVYTKNTIGSDIASSLLESFKIKIHETGSFYTEVKETFNSSGVVTASLVDISQDTASGSITVYYR